MTTSRKTGSSQASGGGPRNPMADAAADIQDAMVKPLKGLADRLQDMNVNGMASAVLENGRKDLEALVKANQKSYQGLQTVVQRQTEMLRQSITEWQGAMQAMPGKDVKDNLAKLDEMGRAAFSQALHDIRELADLAAKSQAEAFEIVRSRIHENVDQVNQLLQKPPKK